MPRASSRFAPIQKDFEELPSFSLVKNKQNGGPGEMSGLQAWAAAGRRLQRARKRRPFGLQGLGYIT
jgi:hypothetical protein